MTLTPHQPRYMRKKVATRLVDQTERKKRRETALSLRMAGASYSEIVKANIGYNNTATVSRDMRKVLTEFTYETPEDVLVLDLARIDEIQKILTAALRSGDLGQAGPIMRCMQFRRETLGITPEVIGERRNAAQNVTNNGIMVVQGTTGDYIAAMAQASGVNPDEVRKELEQVSSSNKTISGVRGTTPGSDPYTNAANSNDKNRAVSDDIVDAEIVPKKVRLKKKRVQKTEEPSETSSSDTLSRLERSAQRHNQEDEQRENFPAVGLSEVLLEVDVPERSARSLEVPIKDYDQNVNLTSGTPYRQPPRKMSPEESNRVVLRRLRKPPKGSPTGPESGGSTDGSGSSSGVVEGGHRGGMKDGARMDILPTETKEFQI